MARIVSKKRKADGRFGRVKNIMPVGAMAEPFPVVFVANGLIVQFDAGERRYLVSLSRYETMNQRELATVRAALRWWQLVVVLGVRSYPSPQDLASATNAADFDALDAEEIEALSHRLKTAHLAELSGIELRAINIAIFAGAGDDGIDNLGLTSREKKALAHAANRLLDLAGSSQPRYHED